MPIISLAPARRVALVLAVAAGAVGGTPSLAAAAPTPGLYQGQLPSGLRVALTVQDRPQGTIVTRVGALCASADDGADGASDLFRAAEAGVLVSRAYLVGADGRFGADTVQDRINGTVDGTAGTVAISGNSIRACDTSKSTVDPVEIPVARVSAARSLVDGTWKRTAAAQDGTLQVWGGGSFIGEFSGSPYVGDVPGRVACGTTPAGLVSGTPVGADGAYSLRWWFGTRLDRQPTTGNVAGSAGTWSWTLPVGASDCANRSGTEAIALQAGLPIAAPFPAPGSTAGTPGSSGAPAPPASAAPAEPAGQGGTQPTDTCPGGQARVVVERLVLCTSVAPKVSGSGRDQRFALTGRVTINGVLYVDGGALSVRPGRGTVTAGGEVTLGAIIRGTDLPIAKTKLDIDARSLDGFDLPVSSSLLKLGSLPIDLSKVGGSAPEVSFDPEAGRMKISAGVQLSLGGGKSARQALAAAAAQTAAAKRSPGTKVPAAGTTLSVNGEVEFGTGGIVASLQAEGFSVPLKVGSRQLFAINQLGLSFDQAAQTWAVSGAAAISLPSFEADGSASASVVGGELDSLALAVKVSGDGAGIAGPYGTYVSGGSFDLGNLAAGGLGQAKIGVGLTGGWPFKAPKKVVEASFEGSGGFDVGQLQLSLGAKAALTAAGTSLANGDANLLVDFDEPRVQLDQQIDISGVIFGQAELNLEGRRMLSRAQLQLKFGPDSVPIKFIQDNWPFGFVQDPPSEIGPLASAESLVSEVGAGARAQLDVWKLSVGASVVKEWGRELEADAGFGDARSLEFLAPGRASGAARAAARAQAEPTTRVVRVASGRQALVVSGAGSPSGRLVIRDPRGRVVVDSDRVGGDRVELRGGRVLWARRADRGLAGAIVRRPAAGRWRVSTGGAQPFTSMRSTGIEPPGDDLARVTGVRGRRTARPGATVSFRVSVPRGARAELRGRRTTERADVGRRLGAAARTRTVRVRIPRDWTGRTLRPLVVTQRGGVPVGSTASRIRIRVTTPRLRTPRGVRATAGTRRLSVRWRRVTGAVRYMVAVRVGTRRWETVTRRTRTSLPMRVRAKAARVEVRAVSASGRVGPLARRAVKRVR